MGHFCDGRASLVVGTHTHVPTADLRVLPGGTAFMSDVGMTGDYDSVIGMAKEEPLQRFLRRIPSARFEPATGPATLCGVAVETDPATGLAARVARGAARRLPGTGDAGVLGLSFSGRLVFILAQRRRIRRHCEERSDEAIQIRRDWIASLRSQRRRRRETSSWPDIPSSRTSCTARGGRMR